MRIGIRALDTTAACCCPLSITYANQQDLGCGADCGAKIRYDMTQVTTCPSPSDNCQGKNVIESVTTDNGCGPGEVETGDPCPIGAGNALSCTDTYALCGPAESFPEGGCVEKYTQTLSVDGDDVERCTITFTITKNGACSGAVSRSCTQLNDPQKCGCCPDGSPNAGTCYKAGTLEDGCCEWSGPCFDGDQPSNKCSACYGGQWHPGWWCEEGECVPEASTLVLFATGLFFLAGYLGLRRKEN